jgi:hypothetical protein
LRPDYLSPRPLPAVSHRSGLRSTAERCILERGKLAAASCEADPACEAVVGGKRLSRHATASHVRALAAGWQPARVPRATLRCAVRQTDQVLLFLPDAALRAYHEPSGKFRLQHLPPWSPSSEWRVMSARPRVSRGSPVPLLIAFCFLSFPRAFLTLFLTGTFSLISSLFSRSIPCSLSAPLLSSFAHLAHLTCPACPFLPPSLVSNDKWASFSSRGASILHNNPQMRQGKNLPQLSPLRTLKLGRRYTCCRHCR